MNTTAIAQHLNVAAEAIVEIQEWARVLWVRVKGLGARFVSKKVLKAMNGSEKQVAWAEQIKADALVKVALSVKQGFHSQQQYEALVATAESKVDAQWWINRRADFRNSACAAGTLAEVTNGYHKVPGTGKVSFF
jgi:hypothetical protein